MKIGNREVESIIITSNDNVSADANAVICSGNGKEVLVVISDDGKIVEHKKVSVVINWKD